MQTSTLSTWTAFEPTRNTPWNLQRVVHLHRRAGFGATWSEAQRDLDSGVETAVDRILSGNASSLHTPDNFEEMSEVIANAAVASNQPNRLKAWWMYRMMFSPDPLGERLTLMWHNHFATSNLKVDDLATMRRQNEILRENSRKPFAELLTKVMKDPAILIWLDADSNRKQHPNENLARELLELFSIGVGNYDEDDVKEAARSLTGWTAKQGRFRFVEAYHDQGTKSLLDNKGRFDGDDVLGLVLNHAATARRIAWRLCDHFFGEDAIDDASIDDLARGLHSRNLDVGWAIETILRSEVFFADANIGNRVLGPVEFIVGAVRSIEVLAPPPSSLVLGEWTARLGQDLFYPPNVFGWPGGRDWLTTRSMIGRTHFATELVGGSLRSPKQPIDFEDFGRPFSGRGNRVQNVATQLLVSGPKGHRDRVIDSIDRLKDVDDARRVEMILASPEAQLG